MDETDWQQCRQPDCGASSWEQCCLLCSQSPSRLTCCCKRVSCCSRVPNWTRRWQGGWNPEVDAEHRAVHTKPNVWSYRNSRTRQLTEAQSLFRSDGSCWPWYYHPEGSWSPTHVGVRLTGPETMAFKKMLTCSLISPKETVLCCEHLNAGSSQSPHLDAEESQLWYK